MAYENESLNVQFAWRDDSIQPFSLLPVVFVYMCVNSSSILSLPERAPSLSFQLFLFFILSLTANSNSNSNIEAKLNACDAYILYVLADLQYGWNTMNL